MDFNFHDFDQKTIIKAIVRKRKYGFVAGYYLMLDDYLKKTQKYRDMSIPIFS
jgi:hypothetical protein